jgi:hypothetical protein
MKAHCQAPSSLPPPKKAFAVCRPAPGRCSIAAISPRGTDRRGALRHCRARIEQARRDPDVASSSCRGHPRIFQAALI